MKALRSKLALAMAGAVALSAVIAAPAEARRGGSFGSRGARTYSAPRPTTMTPGYTAPVQRSMTAPGAGYGASRPTYAPNAPANGGYAQRPGFRPGFGGGILAGLVTGGLLGAMLGHGWGGGWGAPGMGFGGGLMAALFQMGLLALVVWLALRFFRRRDVAQPAGFANAYEAAPAGGPWAQPAPSGSPWDRAPPMFGASPNPDVSLTPADQRAFERLLIEVQEAFGREDYGAVRERTTPEIMSYLAEELSQNATHGRRNEVSQVRLLRSEVSESWREDGADYATVALNYESIDVMRDRQTGQVVEGDPSRPTSTVELWTFVRRAGEDWKLSAIQET